jgi:dolichol-phosphate mannosyltransferase
VPVARSFSSPSVQPGPAVFVSVVVLSRNEERCIAGVLEGILQKVREPFEVLVVDDSRDGTPRIVRGIADRHPNVRLVPQRGRGYTAAFRTAVAHARGEALVILVADGSDDPGDIEGMRRLIGEGYDLVCGSRYMKGGVRHRGSTLQGACSRLVCAGLHALTGIATRDASNSFKMYRTGVLRSMRIEDAGFATSMEVTLKAHFDGRRIAEIPTVWSARRAGSSKFLFTRQATEYARWTWWAVATRVRALGPGKRRS